jgi:hypothetical protein
MAQTKVGLAKTGEASAERVPAQTDLVEWYFKQGWTDGADQGGRSERRLWHAAWRDARLT